MAFKGKSSPRDKETLAGFERERKEMAVEKELLLLKINEISGAYNKLKAEKASLQSQLAEARTKLDEEIALNKSMQHKESDQQTLNLNPNIYAEEQIQKLNEQLQSYERIIQHKDAIIQELEEKDLDKQNQLDAIEEGNANEGRGKLENENEQLKKLVVELEGELENAHDRIVELTRAMGEDQRKRQLIENDASTSTEQMVECLKAELEVARIKNGEMEKQVAELKSDLQKSQLESKELSNKMESKNLTIANLKEEIDQLDNELSSIDRDLRKSERENVELHDRVRLYEKELVRAAELNEQILQEKKSINEKLERSIESMAEVQDECKQSQRLIKELSARVHYLEARNQDGNSDMPEVSVMWPDATTSDAVVYITNHVQPPAVESSEIQQQADNSISQYEMKTQALYKDIERLQELVERLEQENTRLREHNPPNVPAPNAEGCAEMGKPENDTCGIERQLSLIQNENQRLEQMKVDLTNANEALSSEIIHFKEENNRLNIRILSTTCELEVAEDLHAKMNEELQSVKLELRSTALAKEKLEDYLKSLVARNDVLIDEANDFNIAKENLGLSLKEKSSYLEHIENELTDCTRKLASLELELEKEKAQKRLLESEWELSKGRIVKLEDIRNELKGKLFDKDQEVRQLHQMESNALKSNVALEQEMLEKNVEIKKLEARYEELQMKFNELQIDLKRTTEMLQEIQLAKDNLTIDKEMLEERVRGLEREIEGKGNIVFQLSNDRNTLDVALTELTELKDALELEAERVRKEKEEMFTKLQEMVSNFVHRHVLEETEKLLRDQISINEVLSKDIESKKIVIEELTTLRAGLQQMVNSERSTGSSKIRDLEAELAKARLALETHKNKFEETAEVNTFLRGKCTSLEEVVQQASLTIEQMRAEAGNARLHYDELSADYGDLLRRYSRLEQELESNQANLCEKDASMTTLHAQINKLIRQEEKSRSDANRLDLELKNKLEKMDGMASKISDLQAEISYLRAHVAELEVEKSVRGELEEEINAYKIKLIELSSHAEVHTSQVERLQNEDSRKTARVAELESRLNSLTEGQERMRSMLEKSETELVSKEAYNTMMRHFEEKLGESEALAKRLQEADETSDKLQAMSRSYAEKFEAASSRVRELEQELSACRERCRGEKEDFAKERRKFEEISVAYEQATLREKRYVEELKEAREALDNRTESIHGLQSDITEKDCVIEDLQSKLAKLSKKAQLLEAESDEMRLKNSDLMKSLSTSKNACQKLEKAFKEKQDELQDLGEKCESLEDKHRTLISKLNESKDELEDCLARLTNATEDRDELVRAFNALKKEQAETVSKLSLHELQLKSTEDDLAEECKSSLAIQSKLKQTQAQVKSLTLELEEMKNKEEILAEEKACAIKGLNSFKTKFDVASAKVQDSEDEIESHLREYDRLKSSNEALAKENSELRDKYQNLLIEHQSLQQEHEAASEQLDRLENARKHALRERDVLKGEVDTVTSKLTALNTVLDRSRAQREQLLSELNRSKARATELEEAAEDSRQAILKRLLETENKLSALAEEKTFIEDCFRQSQENQVSLQRDLQNSAQRVRELENSNAILKLEAQSNCGEAAKISRKLEEERLEREKDSRVVADLRSQLERNVGTMTGLNAKLATSQTRNTQLQQALNELEEIKRRNEKDITLLQSQVSSLSKTVEESRTVMEQANAATAEKELELEMSRTEKSKMESELLNITREYTATLREKERALDLHGAMKAKYESKCLEFSVANKELASLSMKVKEAESNIAQCEAISKERQELNAVYSAKIDQLTLELEELRLEMIQIRSDAQRLDALKNNMEHERDRAVSDYVHCANLVEESRREKEKSSLETSGLRSQLLETQSKVVDKEKQTRQQDETLIELKRKLSRCELENDDCSKQNQKLKNENRVLTAKLEKLQDETLREASVKYAETVRLKAELDTLKVELQRRNKVLEIHSLPGHHDGASGKELGNEVSKLKEEIVKLSTSEAALKSELAMTRNKMDLYIKDRLRLEEDLKKAALEIHREKAASDKKEKELEALLRRFDRERSTQQRKLEGITDELKRKIMSMEHEIKAIQTSHTLQLAAKKTEIEFLKRRLRLQDLEVAGGRVDLDILAWQLSPNTRNFTMNQASTPEDVPINVLLELDEKLQVPHESYPCAVLELSDHAEQSETSS